MRCYPFGTVHVTVFGWILVWVMSTAVLTAVQRRRITFHIVSLSDNRCLSTTFMNVKLSFFLRCVHRAFWLHSTIKPTNALYFLSISINPTYVSAAIEPSSGVQSTFTNPFGITTYTQHSLIHLVMKWMWPWTPDDGPIGAETCVGLMDKLKK
jgi:hypothetical protein